MRKPKGLGFLPTSRYDGVLSIGAWVYLLLTEWNIVGSWGTSPTPFGYRAKRTYWKQYDRVRCQIMWAHGTAPPIRRPACQVDRYKRTDYDHHSVIQDQYHQGDTVWLYSPQKKKGICPKLMRHFDEPYLFVKKRSDVLYWIQKGCKSTPKDLHHDGLKASRGPNIPDWLSKGSAFKETEPSGASKNPVTNSGTSYATP